MFKRRSVCKISVLLKKCGFFLIERVVEKQRETEFIPPMTRAKLLYTHGMLAPLVQG